MKPLLPPKEKKEAEKPTAKQATQEQYQPKQSKENMVELKKRNGKTEGSFPKLFLSQQRFISLVDAGVYDLSLSLQDSLSNVLNVWTQKPAHLGGRVSIHQWGRRQCTTANVHGRRHRAIWFSINITNLCFPARFNYSNQFQNRFRVSIKITHVDRNCSNSRNWIGPKSWITAESSRLKRREWAPETIITRRVVEH